MNMWEEDLMHLIHFHFPFSGMRVHTLDCYYYWFNHTCQHLYAGKPSPILDCWWD